MAGSESVVLIDGDCTSRRTRLIYTQMPLSASHPCSLPNKISFIRTVNIGHKAIAYRIISFIRQNPSSPNKAIFPLINSGLVLVSVITYPLYVGAEKDVSVGKPHAAWPPTSQCLHTPGNRASHANLGNALYLPRGETSKDKGKEGLDGC